jgi:hypothetical protein
MLVEVLPVPPFWLAIESLLQNAGGVGKCRNPFRGTSAYEMIF